MNIGQAPGLAGIFGFATALICAGLMGYAIQRGATCTVAAVDEIVNRRKATRLIAIIEASLWVTGGLLLASLARLPAIQPASYAVTGWTIAGGALLGYGAFVNRACVFGAVARIGSGEWAYLMTPIGFFLGCWTVASSRLSGAPKGDAASLVFAASHWLSPLLAIFAIWRLWQIGSAIWRRRFAAHIWSPHHATGVIGITFVIMLLTVGAWAYTDVLAEIAHGMTNMLGARFILFLALFAGALLGGATAGRLSWHRPTIGSATRCFIGGLLMGWGSSFIPGGNDGLILIGLPLLFSYAWIAFATMCVTIAAAMIVTNRR
jgi:toxin CptA